MVESETVGYIIPVYNEDEILREELLALSEFLKTLEPDYQIIVIENGSNDNTAEIMKEMDQKFDWIKGYSLQVADYGEALKEGMLRVEHKKNFLLNIDWWDKNFIELALSELDDYDLVVGSKRLSESVDNRSYYRKFLSWGLNFLLRYLVDFKGTETHGLKAFRKSSIEDILEKTELRRGMFDTEVVIRAEKEDVSKTEVPVVLPDDRPPRNWMIQKISQNVIDIWWLTYVIRRDYGFA